MINAIRNSVEKSKHHLKFTSQNDDIEQRIRNLENHVNYLEKTIRRMHSQEEEVEIETQKSVNEEIEEPLHPENISYKEAFRMATLGGAAG